MSRALFLVAGAALLPLPATATPPNPSLPIVQLVDPTGSYVAPGAGGGGSGLGGIATTTAPTYSNGQTVSNFSFTTSGGLRVTDEVIAALIGTTSSPATGTSNYYLSAIKTDMDAMAAAASSTSPESVDTVQKATATDRGLSVTTAGTAQQLMAANSSRRGFAIQNQSSGACYISAQSTATQDYHSLLIAAGAYYETPSTHVSTGAISIVCAVSAASVYAREW